MVFTARCVGCQCHSSGSPLPASLHTTCSGNEDSASGMDYDMKKKTELSVPRNHPRAAGTAPFCAVRFGWRTEGRAGGVSHSGSPNLAVLGALTRHATTMVNRNAPGNAVDTATRDFSTFVLRASSFELLCLEVHDERESARPDRASELSARTPLRPAPLAAGPCALLLPHPCQFGTRTHDRFTFLILDVKLPASLPASLPGGSAAPAGPGGGGGSSSVTNMSARLGSTFSSSQLTRAHILRRLVSPRIEDAQAVDVSLRATLGAPRHLAALSDLCVQRLAIRGPRLIVPPSLQNIGIRRMIRCSSLQVVAQFWTAGEDACELDP
eukprot:6775724-Prymnesium_polylepis.1